MPLYWAKFQKNNGHTFRYDTRIYLTNIENISENDVCVGAIVGKNPGSAKAYNIDCTDIQPINLDGDKLLPTVRNIFLKAFKEAQVQIPTNSYIQVLNLFYLCDEDLNRAITKINNFKKLPTDKTEFKEFSLVWYVWGNKNRKLDTFKNRFQNLQTYEHFFYDQKNKLISSKIPTIECFAKHTQGLAHNKVVPHLSKIISNQT